MGKPGSPKLANLDHARRRRIIWLSVVAGLCCFFYVLGSWQNGGSLPAVSGKSGDAACATTTAALDFEAHHGLESSTTDGSQVEQFPPCDMKYSEYTPCEDPVRALKFPRDRLEYRERHCPEKDELLRCLIPAPPGYKNPFPWPKSRDYAWYANTPHKELTVEKAIQKWVQYRGEKLYFPGGGTFSAGGADKYIADIAALIPLDNGSIRTALDTGCGVASWGAYLLKKNILTVSFAPRDTHVSQIQFALERGVPAILGTMATIRQPYPARSFDMAHCSRCLIPWGKMEAGYLIEVDRVLRPGGYWILSGPPVNWKKYYKGWERTEEDLKAEQDTIEDAARRLCWRKLIEKDNLAIWQKPINHVDCIQYHKKNPDVLPRVCSKLEHPDHAWYRKIETCITPLPDVKSKSDVAGGELAKFPARVNAIPPRIASGSVPSVTAQSFREDAKLWEKRVNYYKTHLIPPLTTGRYRNIMDMNAGLGGFAAALVKDPVWVMNAMPPEAKEDTLGVVFERGFIGTYQNWCEAFSTYPRTYDLIHADNVFSMYQDRCDITYILLEMDRILRPEGAVLMRDEVDVMNKVMLITQGMRWNCRLADHEDGPFVKEKVLVCVKSYWVGEVKVANTTAAVVED
ncbi:hypothetical protein M758_4G015400 [Ceratodon purpureus]|uniref:Methyltransferase n=1 Tax=Ceratodon purpureus TaxID=3225 RepID=A0A8T0I4E0_CERPU|nr:hypothetical protein KC19_4G017300 [Ceratodon purpureus]KAG0617791.1 hypothetical protein M758_4G015400 [Ceratodon purpureus]KAG0617792.1 hypothetical protein M758_4G015400 [Ceratodon purpureus]KAG0617794.1 hypothetical protein M758_4G015400 [Ceratodon purpureus]